MTTTTAAGKKGYRAFSLSLCNHNNHLPWYCRAEPKPPTLKHASRKTMSVSEAQWSFFLQFVTSSCNHTDFERSERFQVPFTLKKYEWFHQYRCPNSKFQSNWQKIECKINILQNLQKYCEIGTVQIEDYDRRRKCRESRGRGDQGENSGWCNKCSVRRKLNTGHLFSSSKRLVLAMS